MLSVSSLTLVRTQISICVTVDRLNLFCDPENPIPSGLLGNENIKSESLACRNEHIAKRTISLLKINPVDLYLVADISVL